MYAGENRFSEVAGIKLEPKSGGLAKAFDELDVGLERLEQIAGRLQSVAGFLAGVTPESVSAAGRQHAVASNLAERIAERAERLEYVSADLASSLSRLENL